MAYFKGRAFQERKRHKARLRNRKVTGRHRVQPGWDAVPILLKFHLLP